MIDNYEATRARRDDLHANWNLVTVEPRDPVFLNAIKNPRIAKGHGSDAGDFGFEEIGVRGVDTYIKTRQRTLH